MPTSDTGRDTSEKVDSHRDADRLEPGFHRKIPKKLASTVKCPPLENLVAPADYPYFGELLAEPALPCVPWPKAHDSARGSRSSMRQDAPQCTLQLSRRPGHFAICTRKNLRQPLPLPCAEPYEVCCRRCSCAPGVCPGFPGWRRGHAHGLAYRVSCHVRYRRHRCASSSATCTQVCRCRAHAIRLFTLSLSMLRTRTR